MQIKRKIKQHEKAHSCDFREVYMGVSVTKLWHKSGKSCPPALGRRVVDHAAHTHKPSLLPLGCMARQQNTKAAQSRKLPQCTTGKYQFANATLHSAPCQQSRAQSNSEESSTVLRCFYICPTTQSTSESLEVDTSFEQHDWVVFISQTWIFAMFCHFNIVWGVGEFHFKFVNRLVIDSVFLKLSACFSLHLSVFRAEGWRVQLVP